MPPADVPPRADYAAAVDALAGRVLGALRGAGDATAVATHVNTAQDPKTALAAVRVLGPDVFAPALLGGPPFAPADAEAVGEAFRVFPPGPEDDTEIRWRDRTAAALLSRHGGEDVPVPAPDEQDADAGAAPGTHWPAWSVHMAQLSPLALPGLDGTVHTRACRGLRDLARGTARAMLRRDFATAARLARWLAYARHRGHRPELDVAPVLRHIELYGGGSVRTALDTAVADRLLRQPEGPAA